MCDAESASAERRGESRDEKMSSGHSSVMWFLCLRVHVTNPHFTETLNSWSVKNTPEVLFAQRAKCYILPESFTPTWWLFSLWPPDSGKKKKKISTLTLTSQELYGPLNQAERHALPFGQSQSPDHLLAPALPWQLITWICCILVSQVYCALWLSLDWAKIWTWWFSPLSCKITLTSERFTFQ